ncbi:MAG: hypothetical protein Q8P52_02445 [bacterium]|nr:hypothetical protein [bacterium]
MNIYGTFILVLAMVLMTAWTVAVVHIAFLFVRMGLSKETDKFSVLLVLVMLIMLQCLVATMVNQAVKALGESSFNHRYISPQDFGGEVKDIWIGESAFPSVLGGKKIRLAQDGTNTYLLFLSEEDESRRMLRVVVKELEISKLPTAFRLNK